MGESIGGTTPFTASGYQAAPAQSASAASATNSSGTGTVAERDPVATYKSDLVVVKAANQELLRDVADGKPEKELQGDRAIAQAALKDAYTQFEQKMSTDEKLSIFDEVIDHTEHGQRDLERTGGSADGTYGGLAALTPGAYHALHNANYNTKDGLMATKLELREGTEAHPENTITDPEH